MEKYLQEFYNTKKTAYEILKYSIKIFKMSIYSKCKTNVTQKLAFIGN